MKKTTAERLKELMAMRNLKQVDILNAAQPVAYGYGVKINKSDISQYISGRYAPTQDKLTILGKALNVSPVWLMGYDVPMAPETSESPPDNEEKNSTDVIYNELTVMLERTGFMERDSMTNRDRKFLSGVALLLFAYFDKGK